MNTQAFSTARAAYQRGDWAGAVSALNQAKAPGELWGEVDHLRGNALMKLGLYADAAEAYGLALSDAGYAQTHLGALNCNRGRALVAAGSLDAAVGCFEAAVADATYPTPYKAYLALGNLYSRRGMAREAGVAWRNAAIDEANPDPSSALVKLGGCFMQLGRPVDAVEAYRTALDFSTDGSQDPIYGELGQAYMASNRVSEAVDAFTKATADGTYTLTPEQSASLVAAQKAMAALSAGGPSETDQLLAGAGYGDGAAQQPQAPAAPESSSALDPLDPMGKTGDFMPSPEDTGFFSVTEEDLMKADKHDRKMRRKHSGKGKKFLVFILLLLVIVAGVGGFAYYKGYGWPTQEAVVSDMFSAGAAGNDVSSFIASGVDDDTKSQIQAIMPKGASVTVSGVDRTTASSEALVSATLASGGTQDYKVALVRDGVGWKVTSVELSFASQGGSGSSTTTTTGTAFTGSAATTAAATK
ncbi:tetratricopeptide repeat protein [uncultured Parolsenella sp.]|uniref:tetratricopeptide repeat protein n=1 Tax=uncultured Parolsenella sp. TaxID=2083008 RepID=UPI0025F48ADE|nr:tetratricopeptide repeat protein [uncultured Parolsenella sp.]